MVLFQNADITVYRLNKDQSYTRINIKDVNWNSKRNAGVDGKGVNVYYTTMIVIPSGYNVTTGDKIVKGTLDIDISRLSDLKEREETVKNSMAVGETQIRRKHMWLKDIEKAKADAEEVHALFLKLLEEVESK